ncbi:MAG: acetyl-CoA carboxylase biotin carboxylase subunit [Deltaproteobacteria bacterium]|nr:acetyl-CoA carboxylase biotin carboxylase subunit [Deltaproteobacteria bacterium]MBW2135318.1 acetyl-CoA carboxylase biotin carboxylase subunit [Deltaproteobacteria bacterium]
MFNKVLVANRGEIAIRVIRACKELGIPTVAIFTEQDANALHIQKADQSILVTPGPIAGYLDYDQIIRVAKWAGADAVHPGYGFIAENWHFAHACEDNGLTFIGPPAPAIRAMGSKTKAREIMEAAGVPIIPGSPAINTEGEATYWAARIGYPLLIKAKAGGGGRGMRLVYNDGELLRNLNSARTEAQKTFGDATVYLEKFISEPKHIEIQLMADRYGRIVHLGERDCSIQRRHQKLIEIAPSLVLTPQKRTEMGEVAKRAARQIGYHSVGTVEFLVDRRLNYYFLEVNTRIQVEHTITELITGIDIVKEQIRLAAGEPLQLTQEEVTLRGHAIECRINAEDPRNNFFPSPGKITKYQSPGGFGIRIDGCIFGGYEVPPYFDPMISKLCAWGLTWEEAVQRMQRALDEYLIRGIKTTIPLYKKLLQDEEFRSGQFTTEYMEKKIQALSYEDVKEPWDIFYIAAAALFFELNSFYSEKS